MKRCIRNGQIYGTGNSRSGKPGDIWIQGGVIEKITEPGEAFWQEDTEYIDAGGCWVVPGLVDLHVHFREPGQTEKEDIASGCRAAAAGGVTTVCCMPNTKPAADCEEIIRLIDEEAGNACGVHVLPVASITVGMNGKTVVNTRKLYNCDTQCKELTGRGIAALSEDGRSVMDSAVMESAMVQARDLGIPVFSHTEDHAITAESPEGEEIIVARDILLAKKTGCPLHLCHISTKGSLDLIRLGKRWGLKLTAETAPHYFTLTREDTANKTDTLRKMNPPLRGEEDREAVRQALKDGTLDVIATDHAPHCPEEKQRPFAEAPFGVVGLETSFAVAYTELVKRGILTPEELVRRMSTKPAEILGLRRGIIAEGYPADLAVIDTQREYTIHGEHLHSKGKNTPFEGKRVFGKVVCTLADGNVIYREGEEA